MNIATVIADLQLAISDAQALGATMPTIDTVIADLQTALADAESISAPPKTWTFSQVGSPLAPFVDATSWHPYVGKVAATMISNITGAWNGAAFDYATGTMHLVGAGGHSDSWINQCFACDVSTGTWRVTGTQTPWPPDQHIPGYAPTENDGVTPTSGNGFEPNGTTPVTPFVNKGIVYFDGKRSSRHNYGGTIWLPTQKQVLGLSGSSWNNGDGDLYCGWFDPVAGSWTRKGNLPTNYDGISSAYDRVRDLVYWNQAGTENIYAYNPATDTHTRIGTAVGDKLNADYGPYLQMCCDGPCDYVYATLRGGWLAKNPNLGPVYANAIVRMKLGQSTPQPWQPIVVNGDTTIMYGNCPGFEYDPDLNGFVFWTPEHPASLSVLDLSTFVINTYPIAGTAPTSTQLADCTTGTWGRFRRVSTGVYTVMVSANAPLYRISAQ